jgi:hypothetical protein
MMTFERDKVSREEAKDVYKDEGDGEFNSI